MKRALALCLLLAVVGARQLPDIASWLRNEEEGACLVATTCAWCATS